MVPGLRVAWEATDRICSKRLAPFLPELIPTLERHQELEVSEEVRAKLLTVSASTIDRLLAPLRRRMGRCSPSTTRSVSALKALISIRTYAEHKPTEVGYVEADLAAHCGTSAQGLYLNTLVAVDLVTGWTECVPVWGKGQSWVGSAIDQVRRELPFRLLGISSDNGSEFINYPLWDYCQRHDITFTRSRAYKKNDEAHVEHLSRRRRGKNYSVVRRWMGYDRYSTKEAYEQLAYLYRLLRLYVNFFQPLCKLIGKRREGAKVHKQYDRAQTPYQRLQATDALSPGQREGLAALYRNYWKLKRLEAIRWGTDPETWRSHFSIVHLKDLVQAGWIQECSDLYHSFKEAMKWQAKVMLHGMGVYKEKEPPPITYASVSEEHILQVVEAAVALKLKAAASGESVTQDEVSGVVAMVASQVLDVLETENLVRRRREEGPIEPGDLVTRGLIQLQEAGVALGSGLVALLPHVEGCLRLGIANGL